MKEYKIYFDGTIRIEADTEDEAFNLAYDRLREAGVDFYIDRTVEILHHPYKVDK